MTPDLDRLVRCYNREIITELELATYIVEATTERPTTEFVESLPQPARNHIREWASSKSGEVGSCIVSADVLRDPDVWAKYQQEQAQRWQQGLYFWRAYFDSEQNT